MKTAQIGGLVEPVKTWNPSRSPERAFQYIDLSAVDNKTKTIATPTRVTGAEAPSRARQLVETGDVLVSTVRPNLNAVAVIPPDLDGATASTGFTVLRPSAELDRRFLFHWVQSPIFVDAMVRRATGASYPAISDRIVKDSEIPVLPLPDQRRIAAILDKGDALRNKRRQVLAHFDTLSQSIFYDMFGDPILNPMNNPVSLLDDLIESGRPITYGILKPGPDIADGVPYIRVADMKEGGIKVDGVRRTTAEISHQYRRSLLRTGDLLMSIRGHVGRFAHIPPALEGANITQDSARLSIDSPAMSSYVREAMTAPGLQQWMARHTKGAAVRGLNIGDLRKVPIPVPSKDMLCQFHERLVAVAATRERVHAGLRHADGLFVSLQSRAFRGGL